MHQVQLLSPPYHVAVQRADGIWHRMQRDTARNGPIPYETEWHHDYLRDSGLP